MVRQRFWKLNNEDVIPLENTFIPHFFKWWYGYIKVSKTCSKLWKTCCQIQKLGFASMGNKLVATFQSPNQANLLHSFPLAIN